MIGAALVGLVLVLPPAPFVSDLTISYGNQAAPWPVPAGYNKQPPIPAHISADTGEPAFIPTEGSEDFVTECRGHCPVPSLDSVLTTDWHSVVRINYGLEVEGLGRYSWDNEDNRPREALNEVKQAMQSIHAVWLRDVLVDLRIVHIHFREDDVENDAVSLIDPQLTWDALKPQLHHPIAGVMRLVWFGGGGAGGSQCLPLSIGAWSGITLALPSVADDQNRRANILHTISQELAHQLLVLEHTQCYRDDAGEPIERCQEDACGIDFAHMECPPFNDISFMGYCGGPCYQPGLTTFPPLYTTPIPAEALGHYPQLRFGPPFGAMARVARNNALAAVNDGCAGVELTGTSINLAAAWSAGDRDGDEFPDALDNCPNVANNEQTDADLDGHGDACDSCAIVRPARTAWALLLPVLGLVAWRARRDA